MIIFKIPLRMAGSLAIVPRPRGGDWLDDDIATLAKQGIDVVVSLLETGEEGDLGLDGESVVCRVLGVDFVPLPIPDLGTPPDSSHFVQSVMKLVTLLRNGRQIAVHCRQSVGRSGLLAVSVAVATGVGLESAIEAVSTARGVRVPETPAQLTWLRQHEHQLSELADQGRGDGWPGKG